jgi:hypothetical protein
MDQIIHQHGSKLLTWKQSKILAMLRAKGPVPFYFKILERLLLPTDNSLRSLPSRVHLSRSQNNQKLTPIIPSTDGHKKEWIATSYGNSFQYRKIIKKLSVNSFTFQHWNVELDLKHIKLCTGCELSMTRNDNSCILQSQHIKTTVIQVRSLTCHDDTNIRRLIISSDFYRKKEIIRHLLRNLDSRILSVDIDHHEIDIIRNYISSLQLIDELIFINLALR